MKYTIYTLFAVLAISISAFAQTASDDSLILNNTGATDPALKVVGNVETQLLRLEDSGGDTVKWEILELANNDFTIRYNSVDILTLETATPFVSATAVTTEGDTVVGDSLGVAARLAIGANGQVLTSNGTTAAWAPAAVSEDANAVSPAANDAIGAIGVLTGEFSLEDHKHPAQAPSADALNAVIVGTDGLHYVVTVVAADANAVSPAANDAIGAIGVLTGEYSLEDHKHPAQAPSADALNAVIVGADGLHYVVTVIANDANAVSPAANDAIGAIGVLTGEYSLEDHKHPAQVPSADALNAAVVGTDGLHFVPTVVANDANAISPASSDAVGAIGVLTGEYSLEDHKHPAQVPSTDALNAAVVGTDGLHFVPTVIANDADAISPAADDATGAIGVLTGEFSLEDHKHPGSGPSTDALNGITTGTDGLLFMADSSAITPVATSRYLANWENGQYFSAHPSDVSHPSTSPNIVDNGDNTWTLTNGIFEVEWNIAANAAYSTSFAYITVGGVDVGSPGNRGASTSNGDGPAIAFIDATAGPIIVSHDYAAASFNASTAAYFKIVQLAESSITQVDPDLVTPDLLHRAFGYVTDDTNFSVVANTPLDFGNAAWSFFNPDGLIEAANDRILIAQAGGYRISWQFVGVNINGATASTKMMIHVNGVEVSNTTLQETQGAHTEVQRGVFWVGDLAVGDIVQFESNHTTGAADYSHQFSVEQQSTSTITLVDPTLLTPETLDVCSVTMSGTPGSSTATATSFPFSDPIMDTTYDPNGLVVGSSLVIKRAGSYSFSLESRVLTQQEIYFRVNGLALSRSICEGAENFSLLWAGNLAVGDVLTVTLSGAAQQWQRPAAVLTQLPTSSVTYLNPLYTEATDLDYFSRTGSHLDVVSNLVDMDGASGTQASYDPNSLADLATNTVVIKKAGIYEISFGGLKGTAGTSGSIRVDGAIIVPYINIESTREPVVLSTVMELTVGQAVSFYVSSGRIYNGSVKVMQLPSTEYITPGDVPVEPLDVCSVTTSLGNTASNSSFPFSDGNMDTKYDPNGLVSGSSLVIKRAGSYSFSLEARLGSATDVLFKVNGSTLSKSYCEANQNFSVFWAGLLSIGDILTVTMTPSQSWQRPAAVLTQLATSSVVTPGSVTANDQAALGYFDLGTMRTQFGVDTSGTAGNRMVTLPVAMANANYTVNATVERATATAMAVIRSKTTTSFVVGVVNGSGGILSDNVSWSVMGLK